MTDFTVEQASLAKTYMYGYLLSKLPQVEHLDIKSSNQLWPHLAELEICMFSAINGEEIRAILKEFHRLVRKHGVAIAGRGLLHGKYLVEKTYSIEPVFQYGIRPELVSPEFGRIEPFELSVRQQKAIYKFWKIAHRMYSIHAQLLKATTRFEFVYSKEIQEAQMYIQVKTDDTLVELLREAVLEGKSAESTLADYSERLSSKREAFSASLKELRE